MAKELETRYYVLERLVKWDKIDIVNRKLMKGESPRKVSEYCKQNGFDISHPKLYEYRSYLQQAIAQSISVESLLGIGKPKRNPILLQAMGLAPVADLVVSDIEVLDSMIQIGFNNLQDDPNITMSDIMRAIELKDKLTQGELGNLTLYGLDQLRELEQAKFQAVLKVVMQYVDESYYGEIMEAMEDAERNFYATEAPELLEDYEKSLREELGEDLEQAKAVEDILKGEVSMSDLNQYKESEE